MALLPYRQIGQEDPEYGALAVNEYHDPDTGEVFPFEAGTEPFDPSTLQPPQQQAPDPMQGALASNTGPSNGGEQQVYSASDPRSEWGSAVAESEKAVSDAGGGMGELVNAGSEQAPQAPVLSGQQQRPASLSEHIKPFIVHKGTPGGMQLQQRKYKGDPGLQDALYQRSAGVRDMESMAAQEQSMAIMAHAKREREVAMRDALRAEGQRTEMQDQLAERNKFIDGKLEQLNKHRQMVRNQPVSQTVYEGDTGKTVLAAISMAFGAFGSALSGGPNTAMQLLDSANKAHVDEQMRRLQNGMRNVDDAEKNMWEDMKRAGNSPEQIRAQLQLLGQEKQAAALRSMAAEQTMQGVRPQLLQTLAGVESDALQRDAALTQQVGAEFIEKYRPGSRSHVSIDPMYAQAVELDKKRGVYSQQEGPKMTTVYGPGQQPVGQVPVGEARDVKEQVGNSIYIDQVMGELEDVAQNWNSWDPAQRAAARAKTGAALLALKSEAFGQLGVLTGPDLDIIYQVLPEDPAEKLDAGGNLAKIRETRSNVRKKMGSTLTAQGIDPRLFQWNDAEYKR